MDNDRLVSALHNHKARGDGFRSRISPNRNPIHLTRDDHNDTIVVAEERFIMERK
jgi:hypothetical protein